MILNIIVTWIVTSISLFVLSRLPLGTDIDRFGTALWSAAVLGLLNAFLGPIFRFLTLPINFITFGLFAVVVNAALFGIATLLVTGFRLKWGFWSALIGAIFLSVFNSLIFSLLPASLG